jgi:hypothetical protein
MMTSIVSTLRLGSIFGLAALLAGCSMGSMFGGGSSSSAGLENATAAPLAVASAQTNALPVIATQCPPIKVRLGGEAMYYYGGGRTGDARALQFQGVIDQATRNCVVSNGQITVNMGVSGRILLGPSGKQNSVNAPIRFAVERDGQAIFTEKYNVPVAITPPAEMSEFVKVVENVRIPYLGGETITIWVGFDPRG